MTIRDDNQIIENLLAFIATNFLNKNSHDAIFSIVLIYFIHNGKYPYVDYANHRAFNEHSHNPVPETRVELSAGSRHTHTIDDLTE